MGLLRGLNATFPKVVLKRKRQEDGDIREVGKWYKRSIAELASSPPTELHGRKWFPNGFIFDIDIEMGDSAAKYVEKKRKKRPDFGGLCVVRPMKLTFIDPTTRKATEFGCYDKPPIDVTAPAVVKEEPGTTREVVLERKVYSKEQMSKLYRDGMDAVQGLNGVEQNTERGVALLNEYIALGGPDSARARLYASLHHSS